MTRPRNVDTRPATLASQATYARRRKERAIALLEAEGYLCVPPGSDILTEAAAELDRLVRLREGLVALLEENARP